MSSVMSWSMNCPMNVNPANRRGLVLRWLSSRHRLVLDHRLGQAVQQVVARRERRQPLEHRPEPALGQPVLARQVHAPKLGAVQATAGFGGMRDGWQLAADHCAGRHGRPPQRGTCGAKSDGGTSPAEQRDRENP